MQDEFLMKGMIFHPKEYRRHDMIPKRVLLIIIGQTTATATKSPKTTLVHGQLHNNINY